MARTVKEITFNEALDHVRNGETVYAVNMNVVKPTLVDFSNLTVGKVLNSNAEYIYQIIKEG